MTDEFKIDIIEPKEALLQFISGFEFDKVSFSVNGNIVELKINAPLTNDMREAVELYK